MRTSKSEFIANMASITKRRIKRPKKRVSHLLWTLSLLLQLSFFPTPTLAGGVSLKGGDLSCSHPDGKEVAVPGITDTKDISRLSIRCICYHGVVKCERQLNTCINKLEGCHYVEDVTPAKTAGSCSQVCRGCQVNGTQIESGQSWPEGDQHHQCFSGVLTTTPKVICSAPMCVNPTIVAGTQCPSCPGCTRAGAIFMEGETKPDITDPCNECTCTQGRLSCIRKSCPVLPCVPRLIKNVPGQCCPVCARAEPAFKNIVMMNKCLFRGQAYPPGKVMTPDRCTQCTCTESLTLQCSRQTCPELFCPLTNQRRATGECCPFCLSEPKSLAGFLRPADVVESSLPPSTCISKGTTYQNNQTWTMGCDNCSCMDGKITCTSPNCPTSCPNGGVLVKKAPTACCSECEFKEGVCTVFGDPHYKTFDGRIFNFQGSCKYLLAQDCEKKKNSSFSIRITNDARDSLAFSWTRTITVRLGEMKVSLLQRMRVKIDGKRVSLPYIKLGALSVMKDGYRVVLRTHEGVRILWDGISFLELTIPPKFRNKICGLCGNFNGDPKDDFFGRKGRHFVSGQTFGDSWRVGGLRACSILPRDMPRSYEPHCTQSWESRISSVRYCNALNSTLFDKCRAAVDPKYYFNACRLDMCECPGDQCHCEVLTAYARECERAGFMIHNWREPTGCKNVTSFKYSGSNHISQEDVDEDVDVKAAKNHNEVKSVTTPKPMSLDASVDLVGKFLPACNQRSAQHCEPPSTNHLEEDEDVLQQQQQRHPRGRQEQNRRKEERQRRRRLERQKKREERKRKKKERRRQRLLKQRQKQKENKQNPPGNDEEDFSDVVVHHVQGDDGTRRSKLSWSHFQRGKSTPPFELLLQSSPIAKNNQQKNHPSFVDDEEEEGDDEEFQVNPLDFKSQPEVKASLRAQAASRVPLPLLDSGGKGSFQRGSVESLEVKTRHDQTSSSSSSSVESDAKSQRLERRNWKSTRRRQQQQQQQQQQQDDEDSR